MGRGEGGGGGEAGGGTRYHELYREATKRLLVIR